jgi:hypothetical protein
VLGVESEIRQKLNAYLRGDLALADFRAWLIQRTWNETDTPEMAHAISYYMDEAASGNLSERKLDEELRRLAASRAAAVARR